jgi:hypothetical protein
MLDPAQMIGLAPIDPAHGPVRKTARHARHDYSRLHSINSTIYIVNFQSIKILALAAKG